MAEVRAAKELNRIGRPKEDYIGSPSTLCQGCGHDSITTHLIRAFWEYGVEPHRVAKMSGIGCSSKTPAYFLGRSHGFNGCHGRMPSIATGANLANRDLVVVGVSGDGDTASIGLGQYCHLIRRNVETLYIIENNGVYGLTKGQFSATADRGSKQKYGSVCQQDPIDCCGVAIELDCSFVARSYSGDPKQLVPLFKAALSHKGTAVLDIISPCVTFNNHPGSTKSYGFIKERDEPLHAIDFVTTFDTPQVEYPEGTTKRIDLPDGSVIQLRKLSRDYDPTQKTQALDTLERARQEGILVTGLLYVNPSKKDFCETLNLVDRPLSSLGPGELRPPEEVLKKIMASMR